MAQLARTFSLNETSKVLNPTKEICGLQWVKWRQSEWMDMWLTLCLHQVFLEDKYRCMPKQVLLFIFAWGTLEACRRGKRAHCRGSVFCTRWKCCRDFDQAHGCGSREDLLDVVCWDVTLKLEDFPLKLFTLIHYYFYLIYLKIKPLHVTESRFYLAWTWVRTMIHLM